MLWKRNSPYPSPTGSVHIYNQRPSCHYCAILPDILINFFGTFHLHVASSRRRVSYRRRLLLRQADVVVDDTNVGWAGKKARRGEQDQGSDYSSAFGANNDFGTGQDPRHHQSSQDSDMYYTQVQLEAEVLDVLTESFSECSLESLQVKWTRMIYNKNDVKDSPKARLGNRRCIIRRTHNS